MFKLPFFKNSLVSIDIGFRNIKVVEVVLQKNKEIFIKNYGIASTPRDCIKNGAIKDVYKVTNEIKKIIVDNGIKSKNAKIVMSGTNIISRVFMIDKAPGQDIDAVVRAAVEQNMPINTNDHQIDYKVLQQLKEKDNTKIKVFVTAVAKTIIKSYIDILLELGLKPLSVDIPANSTAKFFNREIRVIESESWYKKQKFNKASQDTFAVLDFGSETTIINILRDNVLEFNKVILIGSSNLEGVVSSTLGMRLDEAERSKKMYGMLKTDINSSEQQVNIYHILKDNIDKVIKQIHLCFEFYEKRCYGTKIGKIYIIGGGSLLKGLREYLEDSLDIPVYPVGLLSIDGVKINQGLDSDRLNFLINSVGITL